MKPQRRAVRKIVSASARGRAEAGKRRKAPTTREIETRKMQARRLMGDKEFYAKCRAIVEKGVKLPDISPTALTLFTKCLACYWRAYRHRVRRPSGSISSFPIGVDGTFRRLIDNAIEKKTVPALFADQFKSLGLSDATFMPLLSKEKFQKMFGVNLQGCAPEVVAEEYKRAEVIPSKMITTLVDGTKLSGSLDGCLKRMDGAMIPVDFKTTGKPKTERETYYFYKIQLSIYNYLLDKMGHKTAGEGYLLYVYPKSIPGGVENHVKVVKIKTLPFSTTENLIKCALKVRLSDKMPEPNRHCEFCKAGQERLLAERQFGKQSLFDMVAEGGWE